GKLLPLFVECAAVHVADGHDVAAVPGGGAVAIAFAAHPDAGHIDFFVGTQDSPHKWESQSRRAGGEGSALKKLTSCKCIHIWFSSCLVWRIMHGFCSGESAPDGLTSSRS